MSSELSTSSLQPASGADVPNNFVPFSAHIRLVPDLGTGKRRTMIHNLQKAAKLIELSMENAIDSVTTLTQELNIATPVAFTPQFGDFTARATIIGFVKVSRSNGPTVTTVDEIHSGTDQGEKTALIDVNKGTLDQGQNPQSYVDDEVAELRENLIVALDPDTNSPGLPGFVPENLVHIEYNGLLYGVKSWGRRSFPE